MQPAKNDVVRGNLIDLYNEQLFDLEPIQLLGQGSYGAVFKCYSPKFDQYFAVKKAKYNRKRPQLGVMAQLDQYQGFCYAYMAIQRRKRFKFEYIIFELCDGTFREALREMNDDLKLECLAQISDSLNELHSQNAYHMDIKENNILVKVSETAIRVLLADFGLSVKIKNGSLNCFLRDVSCFVRMVCKMTGADYSKFPQKIDDWEVFYKYISNFLSANQNIAPYWAKIIRKIVVNNPRKVPFMDEITEFIRNIKIERKSFSSQCQNFLTVFAHMKRVQTSFDTDHSFDFDVFFKEEERTSPPKTKTIAKRRSRINRDLPKNMWACQKKHKKLFSEKKQFYLCECGMKVDTKNYRHKKTKRHLSKIK